MATGRVPTTANSPLTAKGDLFGYSTTQARVPVGNDGETLVADSSASTGLRYNPFNTQNFAINGGFDFWQRNTSSTSTSSYGSADRWYQSGSGTVTYSRDTDVPSNVGLTYSMKWTTGASSSYGDLFTALEAADVNFLVGRTVTLSFYVKRNSTFSGDAYIEIREGNTADTLLGGTWTNNTSLRVTATPSTSWVRYSCTGTITAGTKGIRIHIGPSSTQASGAVLFMAGVQLEVGSVATPFRRSGGTLAGELAACQRYYFRLNGEAVGQRWGYGSNISTTQGQFLIPFPVQMRVRPTALEQTGTASDYSIAEPGTFTGTCDAVPTYLGALVTSGTVTFTVGTGGLTNTRVSVARANSTTAYLAWSAEL